MTIRYTFYCGTDTNGHQSATEARQLVLELACAFFPNGHSVREEQGRWQSSEGPVDESTMVVTWCCSEGPEHQRTASNFAATYKDMAWQESVMIVKETVDAVLV